MRLRLSGALIAQLRQTAAVRAMRGAGPVVLQAELALEGVEHRLDPLSDAPEAAMPARFAAVRARSSRTPSPAICCFDVAASQALVGQHRGAGGNQPGLDGDGQQVQADLPLAGASGPPSTR